MAVLAEVQLSAGMAWVEVLQGGCDGVGPVHRGLRVGGYVLPEPLLYGNELGNERFIPLYPMNLQLLAT